MTTLHANYAIDAMHRLETMCMMSDINLPVGPLRAQIISAIDVVVQQNRLRDGSRRIVGIYEAEKIGDWRGLADYYAVDATYGWNYGPT